jgi:hypothetical protein
MVVKNQTDHNDSWMAVKRGLIVFFVTIGDECLKQPISLSATEIFTHTDEVYPTVNIDWL